MGMFWQWPVPCRPILDYRVQPDSGPADSEESDVVDVAEDLLFPQDESFFQLSDSDRKELPDSALVAAEAGGPASAVIDEVRHLVQDEDLIAHIHNEELPPDLYYEELRAMLGSKFPGATPQAIEHAVALGAAFDTASGFGLSFGVKKF